MGIFTELVTTCLIIHLALKNILLVSYVKYEIYSPLCLIHCLNRYPNKLQLS